MLPLAACWPADGVLRAARSRHPSSRLPARAAAPPPLPGRRRRLAPARLAPARASSEEPALPDVSDIMRKYGGSSSAPPRPAAPLPPQLQRPPPGAQPQPQQGNGGMGNGLFAILAINFALFAGSNLLGILQLSALALDHWRPHWWQFCTATFMHANWQHLSSNAFALLVFGRMVEEEEGWLGLWLTYLLSGVGGTVASYLMAPGTHTVSLGASGAVFGLFMVSLVAKLKPRLKRLLEFAILGQFVVQQVLGEVQMVAGGKGAMIGGMQVGHCAHLAGAAVGVLLVLLISRLPEAAE